MRDEPRRSWHRPRRSVRLVVGVVLLGAAVAYAVFDPAGPGPFPRCVVYATTGLECPGCGGQRAVHALLNLRIVDAVRANALAVVLVPLLAVHVGRWLLGLGPGGPLTVIGRSRVATYAVLLAVLVFTVVRNLRVS